MKDQELQPKALVHHNEWGVGQVVTLQDDGQWVVISFPSKPDHRMSRELALRSLTSLPYDGLEAALRRDIDAVRSWVREAPLRLVAAILVDDGGSGKASTIRGRLEGRVLRDIKWATWWKRVQPAIKESSCFRLRTDGSIVLRVDPSQVPQAPLPNPPKTKRKEETEPASVLATKLVNGELRLHEIPTVEQQRRVFKTLIRNDQLEWLTGRTATETLMHSVATARMVLNELVVSTRIDLWVDQVSLLNQALAELLRLSADETTKQLDGEWITARTRLIESSLADALGNLKSLGEHRIHGGLIGSFVDLWLALAGRDTSQWSSESKGHIEGALANLVAADHSLMQFLAVSFSKTAAPQNIKSAALEALVGRLDPELWLPVLREMWRVGPNLVRETGWRILTRTVPRGRQLDTISNEVLTALDIKDTQLLQVLADYTNRLTRDLDSGDLRQLTSLQLKLAAQDGELARQLEPTLVPNLESFLESMLGLTPDNADSAADDVVTLILTAVHRIRAKEQAGFQMSVSELVSRITELEKALQQTEQRRDRAESTTDQLRRSFRLPERWAEFQGQKVVLEGVAQYYQELKRAGAIGSLNQHTIDLALRRLDSTLAQFRVIKIGTPGEREVFNSGRHQYIPGEEGPGDSVVVDCPGFIWQDPSGNEVILVKAQVKAQ